ncbi:MAG: biopolymer transporter Tol, partial [Methanotrichaceae archaeon]|nr:biopolymer transporter Tol [Methanotrichaceae archaeon]
PVCTNSARQAQPWIHKDTVVWADGRNGRDVPNWDIYSYNLTTKTERAIVLNSYHQGYPTVYGKYVAWLDVRRGNPDIYLYDLERDIEIPVATLPTVQQATDGKGDPYQVKAHQSSRILSDNKVVWMDNSQGNSQIVMRYFIADPLLLLSTDYPSTNGSMMVWSDNRRGSDWDIYGFDFFSRAEKPICRAEGDQLHPQASGGKVVWSDYRNGDSDIYMVDTATGIESAIASGKGDQVLPSISGDKIVWMDNTSGDWDVYLYENKNGNGTTRPIYKGPSQQMYPIISSDLIVWQDNRNRDWDVYVFDLKNGSETKLTGEGDQISPHVSGNTIVWEDAKTGDISYYLWDKKWGRTYPRPGIQSSPVASGKYIAYVDNADKNASIRRLDTSNWKDELVAAGPGQVKPSMDKKLVWLNTLTGRPRSMTLAAGQTSVICQAPGDQSHPSVGGNDMVGYYVVWMDNRSNYSDVYIYSLSQEIELPLIASPFPEMNPDMSENIISWSAYDPLKNWWTVRTFDVAINNRSELAWGLAAPTTVSVSDQYLTYVDLPVANFGTRVYKKLLYGKEAAPAIPPSGSNPRAGGNIVVYQDNEARGNWDIWLWKSGQEAAAFITDPGDQMYPATDGRTVVWQDNRNGNWDIYAYDFNSSQEIQITKDLSDQTLPDVENGVIVWQDKRKGNWDIYAYNLNT